MCTYFHPVGWSRAQRNLGWILPKKDGNLPLGKILLLKWCPNSENTKVFSLKLPLDDKVGKGLCLMQICVPTQRKNVSKWKTFPGFQRTTNLKISLSGSFYKYQRVAMLLHEKVNQRQTRTSEFPNLVMRVLWVKNGWEKVVLKLFSLQVSLSLNKLMSDPSPSSHSSWAPEIYLNWLEPPPNHTPPPALPPPVLWGTWNRSQDFCTALTQKQKWAPCLMSTKSLFT